MNYSVTRKCRCFQMICWCWEAQLLSKKKKVKKVCVPASHTIIPLVTVAAEACFYFRQESLIEYDREKMRVWGWWRLQILPNNQEDASDQPVSPSCACYLISFIFLVNFTGMKVCGGGGGARGAVSHQPCAYNEDELSQTAMLSQFVLAWIPMNLK